MDATSDPYDDSTETRPYNFGEYRSRVDKDTLDSFETGCVDS